MVHQRDLCILVTIGAPACLVTTIQRVSKVLNRTNSTTNLQASPNLQPPACCSLSALQLPIRADGREVGPEQQVTST